MTRKNYDKISSQLGNAAKYVADETMTNAVKVIRNQQEDCNDNSNPPTLIDTAIYCDGTWQERIHFTERCCSMHFYADWSCIRC